MTGRSSRNLSGTSARRPVLLGQVGVLSCVSWLSLVRQCSSARTHAHADATQCRSLCHIMLKGYNFTCNGENNPNMPRAACQEVRLCM